MKNGIHEKLIEIAKKAERPVLKVLDWTARRIPDLTKENGYTGMEGLEQQDKLYEDDGSDLSGFTNRKYLI